MNGIKRRYENWTKQFRNKTFGTWGKFNNNIERENLKRSTYWAMEEKKKQFLFMFNLKKPSWWRYQPFLLHGHLYTIHFFQEDVNLMSRYASWKPKIYWKKTTFCFGGLLRDLQNPTANEFQLLGLENDSFLLGRPVFRGGELGFGQDYPRKLTWQWKNNHEWRCISHQK